eukprot:TRINITY_DN66566_c0_g1_i2.p1 TRINITY_DN66566_c0_g1~~TRINITY_DN66566_c0_g1_i2.p1  ORF type:complete len:467 (-),score=106.11 TRINITY_DN66566_c0_g1_i2:30-1430(-)
MSLVQAYVYDISQGMARAMSLQLVGKQVDVIPHTGIVCFGTEYFFGSGPCTSLPGQGIPLKPVEILDLGKTDKSRAELEQHIISALASRFTPENYNLLRHNCNHYANEISTFLLGSPAGTLPSRILNVADEALSGPQGAQLRGIIEGMESSMRQQSSGQSMNPFGNMPAPAPGGGAGVPAPATAAGATAGGYGSSTAAAAPNAPISDAAIAAAKNLSPEAAVRLLRSNDKEVAKVALQTLMSIADNVIHKPSEPKFRRIKQTNGAIRRKVTDVPGGLACLLSLGFEVGTHEGEAAWCAPATSAALDLLYDRKAQFGNELDKLYDTVVDESKSKQNNGPGGIMGMIEKAFQDPASLQRMLQNPMVAQMARANPGIVESALQNPQAQAMLQSHPEMRQQVEQLLGRPLPAQPAPVAAAPAAAAPMTYQGYEAQLQQLREMGFFDQSRCLAALQKHNGDVELALAELVS